MIESTTILMNIKLLDYSVKYVAERELESREAIGLGLNRYSDAAKHRYFFQQKIAPGT